jgi:hypothetical protein
MKRTALVLTLLLLAAAPASAQVNFCVARIDDKGVLHLREFVNSSPRADEVEGVEIDKDGRPVRRKVKVTQQSLTENVFQFEATAAKGFDGVGKDVAAADLAKRLEKETPVVVLDLGRKPDATLKATLKKETLVLSVPFSFVGVRASRGVATTPVPTPLPTPLPPRRMP